ncbi:MAG: diaminopimelate epimerase [Thermoanaerobaculia bacterium]
MLPHRFTKMAGGGNDFLLFEADGRALSPEDRRRLSQACRRGLSAGADGALLLSGGSGGRVRVDYYNADGGLASFCANGTRCAARYAATRHLTASGDHPVLETGWGPIAAHVGTGEVTLDLPDVAAPGEPIMVSGAGLADKAYPMAVGVPHLVVFVEDGLADLPIARVGPPLRRHPQMPDGANVNFVSVESPHALSVRTYERGVEGETLACGSGVVASAVAASHLKLVDPPVACRTKSGVAFTVRFEEAGKLFTRVALTGDAREIYSGELTEEAFE